MDYRTDLNNLIEIEKLPQKYHQLTQAVWLPLAQQLLSLSQASSLPFIVGINGAQGSGKSTLAKCLKLLLENMNQRVIILSIDDFYLTKQARLDLSHKKHPLFKVRGVPGTHNIKLLSDVIKQLKMANKNSLIRYPIFYKQFDDVADEAHWNSYIGKPDLIILEGWCVGIKAQTENQLISPINDLEKNNDPDGSWRKQINESLKLYYRPIFKQIDYLIYLAPPSFNSVFNWRKEQEEKLILKIQDDKKMAETMDQQQIYAFIAYFQRLTEHAMLTLNKRAHCVIPLDDERNVRQVINN